MSDRGLSLALSHRTRKSLSLAAQRALSAGKAVAGSPPPGRPQGLCAKTVPAAGVWWACSRRGLARATDFGASVPAPQNHACPPPRASHPHPSYTSAYRRRADWNRCHSGHAPAGPPRLRAPHRFPFGVAGQVVDLADQRLRPARRRARGPLAQPSPRPRRVPPWLCERYGLRIPAPRAPEPTGTAAHSGSAPRARWPQFLPW
jgi:hypothetical protein